MAERHIPSSPITNRLRSGKLGRFSKALYRRENARGLSTSIAHFLFLSERFSACIRARQDAKNAHSTCPAHSDFSLRAIPTPGEEQVAFPFALLFRPLWANLQVAIPGHSSRSEIVGSTRVARWAGM